MVVFNRDRDFKGNSAYKDIQADDFNQTKFGFVFYAQNRFTLYKNLIKEIKTSTYIYLNSVFSLEFSLIPLIIAFFTNTPVILSPRGELLKSALDSKKLSKWMYLKCFSLFVRKNTVFQGSSKTEVDAIQRVFKHNKAFVLGNLFNFIDESVSQAGIALKKEMDAIKLVMLCRISPIKNIEFLVPVLNGLDTDTSVTVDVYGIVDDQNYSDTLTKLIRETLSSKHSINFKGSLNNPEIPKTITNYHALINCSLSENFGQNIVESLGCGRPVFCSHGTPWNQIYEKQCGYYLPLQVEEYIDAMEQFIRLDHLTWRVQCENARSYFCEKYTESVECLKYSLFSTY